MYNPHPIKWKLQPTEPYVMFHGEVFVDYVFDDLTEEQVQDLFNQYMVFDLE